MMNAGFLSHAAWPPRRLDTCSAKGPYKQSAVQKKGMPEVALTKIFRVPAEATGGVGIGKAASSMTTCRLEN